MDQRKLLVVGITFILLHICQSAHNVVVTPTVVGVGLTKQLEVKCTFTRDSNSVINSLLSLHIAHSSKVDNPVFSLLASINSNDNKVSGAILNTGAKASAVINNNGESYITIVWSYPQLYNGGRYRCRANGVNNIGKVVDSIKGQIVTAQSPNLTSVVQELIILSKAFDDLQAKFTDYSAFQNNKFNATASLNAQFIVSDVFKGRRYYLDSKTYYWTANDAHFRCNMYGGYVADIDDAEEFEFVRAFLLKNPKFFEVLIAGSDEDLEGSWVNPYSKKPVKYLNLQPGQPDGGRGANNLCMWRDARYYMSDCIPLMTYDWSFLCEIPIVYTQ